MATLINRWVDSSSSFKLGLATITLTTIGYGVVQVIKRLSNDVKPLPPPPGPPRQFLIGNLRQFPKDHFYEKFCEWQKEYGDVVYVEIPGIPMVIISSYEIAQNLLGKRPNSTSGRLTGYMLREVMGLKWTTTFLQPGPQHSHHRQMLRRGIGPQRVASHTDNIEKNTVSLVLSLQDFEGDPHALVLDTVGRIVIEVTYGTKLRSIMGKELSSWNAELVHLFSSAFSTFWLVDIFHFLRLVPSWVPGASFKKIGDRSIWLSQQVRYTAFNKAQELYKSGDIGHSLAADLLDEFGSSEDVMDTLATLYGAGSDTTASATNAFIYALFLFPEVSQKVYEEVITVTNGTRLPQTSDRVNLPYAEAVWKEAFRWKTFVPIGIAHVNTQDEIVNGSLIKAGTLINLNNGFMLMDPKVWGDPEAFRPERFLEAGAHALPNPLVVAFGYGARVCPGIYLADKTGFHIATTIAALYEIAPLEGRSRPKPELTEYTDTAFRLPVGFECRFIPRDARAEHLLRTMAISTEATIS